jgi:hypothetical protein
VALMACRGFVSAPSLSNTSYQELHSQER